MLRLFVAVLLFACGLNAWADEIIPICYNYGCMVETEVRISESRWSHLAGLLSFAVDAEGERKMLSVVIGQLYAWAGEQTPIHNDRGGNFADDHVAGAMDCIDHSTTTNRFLLALERRGLIVWHRVIPVQVRNSFYMFDHFTAAIEEKPVIVDGVASRYVVDSWFVDNGKPAVILPLDEWKRGAGPDV